MENFNIFKNTHKTKENQPDWKISNKDETGKFVEIGACWTKVLKDGSKYLSCKLSPKTSPQTSTEANKQAEEDFLAL